MSGEAGVPDWLREHYARVDANDFAYVLGRFADSIEVRFGNRPPAVGREAARELLADVHRAFASSQHRFRSIRTQLARNPRRTRQPTPRVPRARREARSRVR